MITFKQYLSERRMNQRSYTQVFKRLNDDAKIGFEIEVFCPAGSDLWIEAHDEPETVDIRKLDTYGEFDEYFIIGQTRARAMNQQYGEWLGRKEDQFVDANWSDYDDDEARGRKEAEKRFPRNKHEWSDWFADEFRSSSQFIEEYELEPRYGWASATEVFKSAPGNVQYMDGWKLSAKVLAEHLGRALKAPVSVNAHGYSRWNVTHDSSITDNDGTDYESGMKGYGFEIVSPVLAAGDALPALSTVLSFIDQAELQTNSSTGLHVNISLKGMEMLDPLKLVLFMGDKHVLKKFEREANTYTRSQLQAVIDGITDRGFIPRSAEDIIDLAQRALKETGKYYSVNLKFPAPKYLEFRAAGGEGYHRKFDDLKELVGRWLSALEIACDPNLERQEYLKKVIKLLELIPMSQEKKQNKDLTYLEILKKEQLLMYQQLENPEPGSQEALVAVRSVLMDLGQRIDDGRIEIKFQDRKDMRSLIKRLKLDPEKIWQGMRLGAPGQLVRMALRALKLV